MRELAARSVAVSASQLEGVLARTPVVRPAELDRLGEPVDPGLAKDARDLELAPWHKGRYGTAIGRAVHGVLQTVDLATGKGLPEAVAAQTLAEGVTQFSAEVTALARAALASDVVRRAAARPHWRETYVGAAVGDRILEGVIDLLYRDDDGLVVVDYKTDAVPVAALDARVDFYRPQLAAYAAALTASVGGPVPRCVLLFLTPDGAVARQVDGVEPVTGQIRDLVNVPLRAVPT
ncbi:PD-(D/E)XK nuclease family protein [Luedemannella flava]